MRLEAETTPFFFFFSFFHVITQSEELIIKMAETDVRTVHTHPHDDTLTHMHCSCSASGCHRWSLLLIAGLELSSQVLPVKDEKYTLLESRVITDNAGRRPELTTSTKSL